MHSSNKSNAMTDTVTINLTQPIKSVSLLDNSDDTAQTEQQDLTGDLEIKKNTLSQLCTTLKGIVTTLNEFQSKIITENKEQIVKLSIEIASKILAKKVQEGDYEIGAIIKEALSNAPTHENIVVHLNPQDNAQFEQLKQQDTSGTFDSIKFVADPKIKPAECLLESPKGIIESVIEENLERIAEALKKTG